MEVSNALPRNGRLTISTGRTRGGGIVGWKVRESVDGRGSGGDRRYREAH